MHFKSRMPGTFLRGVELYIVPFRRNRTKIRKKTKYTILDDVDDQERMELRPKYGKVFSTMIPWCLYII